MAKYQLTRRPVRIISNAPQPAQKPRSPEAGAKPCLVYMGSFMPYKNVETMVAGMAGLPGFTLHLLSRITPQRRAELEKIIPPGAKVEFHNGVTDEEYATFLETATALVSLSRAEGYGLPLVEAMALGTPVIASDIPIFREVGGDAASYVDPASPQQFADAVKELDDRERWEEISRRSVARAREFSWEESARQLVDVAHDIVAQRRGKMTQRRGKS